MSNTGKWQALRTCKRSSRPTGSVMEGAVFANGTREDGQQQKKTEGKSQFFQKFCAMLEAYPMFRRSRARSSIKSALCSCTCIIPWAMNYKPVCANAEPLQLSRLVWTNKMLGSRGLIRSPRSATCSKRSKYVWIIINTSCQKLPFDTSGCVPKDRSTMFLYIASLLVNLHRNTCMRILGLTIGKSGPIVLPGNRYIWFIFYNGNVTGALDKNKCDIFVPPEPFITVRFRSFEVWGVRCETSTIPVPPCFAAEPCSATAAPANTCEK